VVRVSFFVALVIAGKAIAVLPVAHGHGLSNGAPQVSVISAALPDGSIIATGSVPIVAGWPDDDTPHHHRTNLCRSPRSPLPKQKT